MLSKIGRLMDAISTRDYTALRAFLTDDAVLDNPFQPPESAMFTGPDAILNCIRAMEGMFESYRVIPTVFYPSPETGSVAVEAVSEGMLKSGVAFANRYIYVFVFKGEKIAEWKAWFDPASVPKA
jgi:ketosteroid isomerase-like protein